MLPSDITSLNAVDLSQVIREKHASCVEVMQAYLSRIEKYNSVYNAIVSLQPERDLLGQAKEADNELAAGRYRGWMHGMPHAVKDLAAVEGLRHTSGSLLYADRIAEQDSAMVSRIRAAGAIFIGKTNTPEFGLGSQSYNSIFGATGCAYDPALTSGGSSGGAGSALGTQMLPVADGSDMMGSLRNPGAFNNVIGFRPSTNVMSGGSADQRGLSTSGPMGRNTEDTIQFLKTIAAVDFGSDFSPMDLSSVKIGWLGSLDGYFALETGILELCQNALEEINREGAVVEEVHPRFEPNDLWFSWTTLRHLGRASMKRFLDDLTFREKLKPDLIWEIEQSQKLTEGDRATANAIRGEWYRELDRLFGEYDFLAIPSAQVFPYPKEVKWPNEIEGREMDTYHRWMQVVVPAGLVGLPVVNIPAGFGAEGLPAGLQMIGPRGSDTALLQLAQQWHAATQWPQMRPPPLA